MMPLPASLLAPSPNPTSPCMPRCLYLIESSQGCYPLATKMPTRHLSPRELLKRDRTDDARHRTWLDRLAQHDPQTIQQARHRIGLNHDPHVIAADLGLPLDIVHQMRVRSLRKRRLVARQRARVAGHSD